MEPEVVETSAVSNASIPPPARLLHASHPPADASRHAAAAAAGSGDVPRSSEPLTFRGVRSLKHRGSHDSMRRSASLTELSSARAGGRPDGRAAGRADGRTDRRRSRSGDFRGVSGSARCQAYRQLADIPTSRPIEHYAPPAGDDRRPPPARRLHCQHVPTNTVLSVTRMWESLARSAAPAAAAAAPRRLRFAPTPHTPSHHHAPLTCRTRVAQDTAAAAAAAPSAAPTPLSRSAGRVWRDRSVSPAASWSSGLHEPGSWPASGTDESGQPDLHSDVRANGSPNEHLHSLNGRNKNETDEHKVGRPPPASPALTSSSRFQEALRLTKAGLSDFLVRKASLSRAQSTEPV